MPTIVIGSARRDENGKYVNGKVGDNLQKSLNNDTVGEVSMQNFYVHSKGWYILRPISVEHANKLASNMKIACDNPNIGYDQNNRLGVVTHGIDTNTPTESDCGTLVRAVIKKSTGKDVGNFTTANEVKVLEKSGLFEKRVAYVSQVKTPIYNGDVLVTKTKGHTVIVVSGKARTVSGDSKSLEKEIVEAGQQHAINFTGVQIQVDGEVGPETNKMKHRVLQHAMNLDYGNTLEEDGKVGTKSKAKLGSHYVKKGEKQFMVTAAEILLMLHGIDPKGVEYPGEYGNGLVSATKQFFGDDGLKITAVEFLTLIQ